MNALLRNPSIYFQNASGSRINYNKTKAISIGNARHRKPKFNKYHGLKKM